MLQHLYAGETLSPPTGQTSLPGDLIEFEQKEFISALTAAAASMDSTGYAYIPSGCKDRSTKCRLHISFQ